MDRHVVAMPGFPQVTRDNVTRQGGAGNPARTGASPLPSSLAFNAPLRLLIRAALAQRRVLALHQRGGKERHQD